MYTTVRADSRLAPSQWETWLQRNAISHWLGANLESSLHYYTTVVSMLLLDQSREVNSITMDVGGGSLSYWSCTVGINPHMYKTTAVQDPLDFVLLIMYMGMNNPSHMNCYTPRFNKVERGYTGFTSAGRLSVRPAGWPYVCGQIRVHSVTSTILAGSILYLHIL